MKPKWTREFPLESGPPGPPDVYQGTVYIGDNPAPAGVLVQGVIGEYSRGECVTNSAGGYWLQVPQEGFHPDDAGPVTFYINQVKAAEEGQITGKILEEGAKTLDLHVATALAPEDALRTALTEILEGLEETAMSLTKIRSALRAVLSGPTLGEMQPPFYPPYKVTQKRGRYSANYLGEFITPYAASVQELAAQVRDKRDDDLIIAAYNLVAPAIYIWDDRRYAYDHWNFPSETAAELLGDCEDTTFLLCSILRALGVETRAVLGKVYQGDQLLGGHAWVEVLRGGKWEILETTHDIWHGWGYPPEEMGLRYAPEIKFTDRTVEAAS